MRGVEGWVLTYVLNALWQAPLVCAAGWLAARAVRRAGAKAEHRVWVAALLLESALPAFSSMKWAWLAALLARGDGADGQVRVTVAMAADTAAGGLHLPGAVLHAAALVYLLVVLAFLAQLLWQAWTLRQLRGEAGSLTLDGAAAACWERCAARFGVETATVGVSTRVHAPVTMGVRDKVLLLPEEMARGLAVAELETVLAHEFAHMRRNDFAKNLLYELAALPLRFHPACWLARTRVTETREMVCDAMAAEVAGRAPYARSLLRLAAQLTTGLPVRVPQAIGIFDTEIFERRMMKLAEKQLVVRGARRVAMVALCAALGVGTCASALVLRLHVNAAALGANVDDGAKPKKVVISPGVAAGMLLTKVAPKYPEEAKKARIQGTVVLNATIGKDGTMQNLMLKSGPKELQQSSLDAVKQWTYKPYLLNGEPVEVETEINVIYTLADKKDEAPKE